MEAVLRRLAAWFSAATHIGRRIHSWHTEIRHAQPLNYHGENMTFRMFSLWVASDSVLCIPLEAASTAFVCAFQTSPQTGRAGQAKKPSTA